MPRLMIVLGLTLVAGAAMAQTPDGPPSAKGAEVRYLALVKNSPWFRANRERVECGPIQDAGVRATCIASFGPRPLQLPAGFVAPPPTPQAKKWTAPKD
jgi:hypothetical protein